jgi:uncharacterized protein involved in response to NO
MLFGYLPGAMSGFLLTAVPNWTGRMPVVGWPLARLFGLWAAGQVAWLGTGLWGLAGASAVAVLYLPVLLLFLGREVVSGKNWANLKVIALIGLLMAAQMLWLGLAFTEGQTIVAERLAISAGLGLVMLIGGRVIPSFTTNWLKARNSEHLPKPFGDFDVITVGVSAVALGFWVVSAVLPLPGFIVAWAMALAAVLNFLRLGRWRGQDTLSEPLVAILHVAFAFVPLGFVMASAGMLYNDGPCITAAIHAWTAGAIALMTLAIMTRATRGHTGYPLEADLFTATVYGLVTLAALMRVSAALMPNLGQFLLQLAASFWVAGFLLFCLLYGPMLFQPRQTD